MSQSSRKLQKELLLKIEQDKPRTIVIPKRIGKTVLPKVAGSLIEQQAEERIPRPKIDVEIKELIELYQYDIPGRNKNF